MLITKYKTVRYREMTQRVTRILLHIIIVTTQLHDFLGRMPYDPLHFDNLATILN